MQDSFIGDQIFCSHVIRYGCGFGGRLNLFHIKKKLLYHHVN